MNHSIRLLTEKIELLKKEVSKLEQYEDFEMVSELGFVDNDIQNKNLIIKDYQQALMALLQIQKIHENQN